MLTRMVILGGLLLAAGCSDDTTSDGGSMDGGVRRDSGARIDAGRRDASAVDSAVAIDAGATDGGAIADAAIADATIVDAAIVDAAIADATVPLDATTSRTCPCFGTDEIGIIEAVAAGGAARVCEVDGGGGTYITQELSATVGAAQLRVYAEEIHGFAGTDLNCGAGCVDLDDDDGVDNCLGEPLPPYASTMLISPGQHASCRALILSACLASP